jgi:hypothetical protein
VKGTGEFERLNLGSCPLLRSLEWKLRLNLRTGMEACTKDTEWGGHCDLLMGRVRKRKDVQAPRLNKWQMVAFSLMQGHSED